MTTNIFRSNPRPPIRNYVSAPALSPKECREFSVIRGSDDRVKMRIK